MCILCLGAVAGGAAAKSTVGQAVATAHVGQPAFLVASFVRPVLVSFFGVNIYSYGACVAAALGVAFFVFGNDLARSRIKLDESYCFMIFLLGFATGSKGHVALSALGGGEELTWKALDIRSGHSFMGSIIGAVGCMLMFIKYHRVSTLAFLDVLLPCCFLGHVIGKFGCFFSGDGCYGIPADPSRVPWAMSFPNASVPTYVPVHPTPLYEAALSFGIFACANYFFPLPSLSDQDSKPATSRTAGRRTALVLVLYGFSRVLVEQFRRHPPIQLFLGLSEYQALALALVLIGICLEIRVRLLFKPASAVLKKTKKKKRVYDMAQASLLLSKLE
jgi:phosphatidylglycerol:prolipoprotein diacylglycerol transferase